MDVMFRRDASMNEFDKDQYQVKFGYVVQEVSRHVHDQYDFG